MRKVLGVTAVAAAGLALLACNRTLPRQEVMYAPPPPATYGNRTYGRQDLPPAPLPQTYGHAPYGRADVPSAPLPQTHGNAPYGRADAPHEEQQLVWKSSPRWATTKSNAKSEAAKKSEATKRTVKQDPPDKFKLAQAKAAKVGVENLTEDDIEGLDLAQIKELRGY